MSLGLHTCLKKFALDNLYSSVLQLDGICRTPSPLCPGLQLVSLLSISKAACKVLTTFLTVCLLSYTLNYLSFLPEPSALSAEHPNCHQHVSLRTVIPRISPLPCSSLELANIVFGGIVGILPYLASLSASGWPFLVQIYSKWRSCSKTQNLPCH